ncbi:MAG TPA: DUF397 domain-containing protein [Micromonosporaceae bacterium]|nr:DUF397 domain-containing protein [Micromonosporaceae bacterium]
MNSVSDVGWRKSSRCESNGCVEARQVGAEFRLRDSVTPDPVLRLTAEQWAGFKAAIRSGAFDVR